MEAAHVNHNNNLAQHTHPFAPDETHPALNAILGANPFIDVDLSEILSMTLALGQHLASRPFDVFSRMSRMMSELFEVAAGVSPVQAEPGDKRFADPAFDENPFYRALKQGYLVWRSAMRDLIGPPNGADWKDFEQLRFTMGLLTEAVAPTNFLLGNPAALKRMFDTAGFNLLRGWANLIDDFENNGAMPSQVDKRPFKVGGNIAASPGAVVYRSPLCEVIQYQPKTPTVFSRPLVIIPPQINKYYVMDLAPGRSLVQYAVEHGIQVFAISWRNPGPAQADWGLDDYVEACTEAIEAARSISKSPDVNVLGICAGGITTSLVLGHLAALGDQSVNAATMLVTMLDTSLPSMTGMFATEETIARAIERSRKKGVLAGEDMARVFAWLRPNDLVWNYFVNNYLMGETPAPFDILFWNADSTNLPARLHEGFLELFLRNPLTKPGAIEILGRPVDLRKVTSDVYLVAGQTDHICTWRACYRATRLFGGNVEFVLNSSGHVQTLVNPPSNAKAHYHTNPRLGANADEWFSGATDNRGSWWDHWLEWIRPRSGAEKKAPRELGNAQYHPREAAPGLYVTERPPKAG